jgi:hypothetical protein
MLRTTFFHQPCSAVGLIVAVSYVFCVLVQISVANTVNLPSILTFTIILLQLRVTTYLHLGGIQEACISFIHEYKTDRFFPDTQRQTGKKIISPNLRFSFLSSHSWQFLNNTKEQKSDIFLSSFPFHLISSGSHTGMAGSGVTASVDLKQ